MQITPLAIPEVLRIEPRVFGDERGWFLETFQAARHAEAGITAPFVQDNASFSRQGVLRGLHFQHPNAQGKLVHVLQGRVFDVAVDIRRGSPTFGHWVGETLDGEHHHQIWIPPGFAHGFCVVSETALFAYKCTDYYAPDAEHTIRWDDADLGIDWPLDEPEVSAKDRNGKRLADMTPESLPAYAPRAHA